MLDPFDFAGETRLSFRDNIYDRLYFRILYEYETLQVWFGSDKKYQKEGFRALHLPITLEYDMDFNKLYKVNSYTMSVILNEFLMSRGYKLYKEFTESVYLSFLLGQGSLRLLKTDIYSCIQDISK